MFRNSRWAAVVAACSLTSAAWGADSTVVDLFHQLDRNNDGQLTADEIPESQAPFFERVLRLGDKNEDQILTKDEFLAALQDPQTPDEAPSPKPETPVSPAEVEVDFVTLFQRLDRNGDGKLTANEFPEAMRDRAAQLMEKTGKQELTLDEFVQGMKQVQGARETAPVAERTLADQLSQFDKNGDGKLAWDELPEAARARLAPLFERTGTKEIDISRLQNFARVGRVEGGFRPGDRERRGMRGGPPRMPGFFAALDADKNGRISKAELANYDQVFDRFDRNSDGELDFAELMGFERGGPEGGLENRSQGGFDFSSQLFNRLDADGDEALTKDEFPERLQDLFESLDKNSDGKVSREELKAGAETIRQRFSGGGQSGGGFQGGGSFRPPRE